MGSAAGANSEQFVWVLLPSAELPTHEDVVSAHRKIASGQELNPLNEPQHLAFALPDGSRVYALLVPAVLPNGEAEAHAKNSVAALTGPWQLPPYEAHLFVQFFRANVGTPGDRGRNRAMEQLAAFTRVVAAISVAAGAVGVYFGYARATHDPSFIARMLSGPDVVAGLVPVLNGVSVARPGDRVSLLSLGMSQFSLPNVLLTAPWRESGKALEQLFDLLIYMADRGVAPRQGETIGQSRSQRMPVRYGRSPINGEPDVLCVDL